MAKKSKTNLVLSIIVIVLGVLTILPLFINYFGLRISYEGDAITYAIPLFGKYTLGDGNDTTKNAVMDLFKEILGESLLSSKPLFITIQVITVIGAIGGVALAVFAILKLVGVKIGILDTIAKFTALVLVGVAVLAIVLGLIFIIANLIDLKDVGMFDKTKNLFFGIEGWLIGIVATAGCSILSLKNN